MQRQGGRKGGKERAERKTSRGGAPISFPVRGIDFSKWDSNDNLRDARRRKSPVANCCFEKLTQACWTWYFKKRQPHRELSAFDSDARDKIFDSKMDSQTRYRVGVIRRDSSKKRGGGGSGEVLEWGRSVLKMTLEWAEKLRMEPGGEENWFFIFRSYMFLSLFCSLGSHFTLWFRTHVSLLFINYNLAVVVFCGRREGERERRAKMCVCDFSSSFLRSSLLFSVLRLHLTPVMTSFSSYVAQCYCIAMRAATVESSQNKLSLLPSNSKRDWMTR